ncbi:hypothetical protein BV25DRAFT_1827154 [Artomyces pyxidatus]|uniref:Uncharacterized protein n=1 Tax=Artomyces pyxidatus TaxID=48021 RepID=A0ACB8SXK0_9AGAM|nr:hypothetical protein BV25DRAFT_1827154 [Artomyces pyxidatus]
MSLDLRDLSVEVHLSLFQSAYLHSWKKDLSYSRHHVYTASERPSSSRTSASQYYNNAASSGSWSRQPSRPLDTSSLASLIPTTFLQETPSPIVPDANSRTYHLEIVQQPEVTAEFGSAALSRLPLAPPLVAQLVVRDHRGNVVEGYASYPPTAPSTNLTATEEIPSTCI